MQCSIVQCIESVSKFFRKFYDEYIVRTRGVTMRIPPVSKNDAGPELKELYDTIEKSRGRLWNIYLAHSHTPDILETHLKIYQAIMFARSSLPRRHRELLGCYVSYMNRCEY